MRLSCWQLTNTTWCQRKSNRRRLMIRLSKKWQFCNRTTLKEPQSKTILSDLLQLIFRFTNYALKKLKWFKFTFLIVFGTTESAILFISHQDLYLNCNYKTEVIRLCYFSFSQIANTVRLFTWCSLRKSKDPLKDRFLYVPVRTFFS